MKLMNRRQYLAVSTGACLGGMTGSQAAVETKRLAEDFLEKFEVPGLSIAIAKDGQIVRKEAFGFADLKRQEVLGTDHRFRIASISKPITSAAIFLLIEGGKLKQDDLVFGESGLLGIEGPAGITLKHLLTHTSGGWKNDKTDPMFKEIKLDHAGLIAWTLKNVEPKNPPGEKYAYSNFGYCLLGRIIEKVSGQGYGDFVRENVLKPCGAAAMTIGEGEREVVYYMGGKPVKLEMNVARMDSHGGWVGTPGELVNFALRVDGFPEPADILKKESIATMKERVGVNKSYACGWSVNEAGNYWHGGSLPGLTSLLVRTEDGHCWAACANTRSEGIGLALDRMMWKIARAAG